MGRKRVGRSVGSVLGLCLAVAAGVAPGGGAQEVPNKGQIDGGSGIHTGGAQTASGAEASVSADQSVITASGRHHHRGGGQRRVVCRYTVIDGIGSLGPEIVELIAGSSVIRTCYDAATDQRVSGPIAITVGPGGGGRPVVTQALIDMALANIDINLPTIALSPPAVTLPNFDTWLWTTDQPVETASATAAGVTITVAARITSTRFEIGPARAGDNGGATVTSRDDRTAITCAGVGTPYDPGRPPGDQQPTCRFRFSTPTRNLTIDTTATWHIAWTATNGTTGDLGSVRRTSTAPYRVQEKQSVIRTR